MGKLVSMKVDPAERKRQMEPATLSSDVPIYPYGLRIDLDDDALKKLEIDTLPKVGKRLMLRASVDVTNVSESTNTNDRGSGTHQHRSVGLQITDLCLEDEGTKDGDAQKALYKE